MGKSSFNTAPHRVKVKNATCNAVEIVKVKAPKPVKQPHGIIKHVTYFQPIEPESSPHILVTVKGDMPIGAFLRFQNDLREVIERYEKMVVPES
jgi:hypothetical protein